MISKILTFTPLHFWGEKKHIIPQLDIGSIFSQYGYETQNFQIVQVIVP